MCIIPIGAEAIPGTLRVPRRPERQEHAGRRVIYPKITRKSRGVLASEQGAPNSAFLACRRAHRRWMETRSGEIQPFLLTAGIGALFWEQIQSDERHM